MHRFTALYDALDSTTRTSEKQAALEAYFREAPPADAAWALHFLCGRRPRRAITHTQLRAWASEEAGVPAWLLDESYEAVGDLSETIALLLPERSGAGAGVLSLADLVTRRLLPLPTLDEQARRALLVRTWRELTSRQRFVFHKLISGSFRVGAARRLVVRALAAVAKVDPAVMDHRLLGTWKPTAADFGALLRGGVGSHAEAADDVARPYPFFLASPLEDDPRTLGDVREWRAEWKWDGIRAQMIRRGTLTLMWSRGEELVGAAFPEVEAAARALPDGTVLDGELLAWERGSPRPLPFSTLQLRLNRKAVAPTLFPDVPVRFVAYDLLEESGLDARQRPLDERVGALERIVAAFDDPMTIGLAPPVEGATWDDLGAARRGSRERGVEGLMLKRRASPYAAGRARGDWWKWKIDPYTIDAVMTHAQHGSGIRASLYTDYTFGLWHGGELVTIAKAYSGLSNDEIAEVDAFVRRSTLSRHGPVRMVSPELVFELSFEGVQESRRHKSGLALRFPRMSRWRKDKKASEADTLDTLRALLRGGGA